MFTRLVSIATLALTTTLAISGCSSSAASPPAGAARTSLGHATAGALDVELLSSGPLATGLTPIYLRLTDGGVAITDAEVRFVPRMDMGTTSHSAPVLGGATRDDVGDYATGVVFQMPSSDMGRWSATVEITRAGQAKLEAAFPTLAVADSGRAKTFASTDAATGMATKYVASLNFTGAPKVGLNPATVTLHRMADMTTFEPVAGATLTLDPQMPSMGHGSPGTVQPTATSLGRYDAQVSFSMPGTWETALTVKLGDQPLGAVTFTTSF